MAAPHPAADPGAALAAMDRDALPGAARRMRRMQRDAPGHDPCRYPPQSWGLLPETQGKPPEVPEWPAFVQGCAAFRASLDRQGAHLPRTGASFEEGERHDQA